MYTVPDPIRIAEGTYLVRPLVHLPETSLALHVNSLVIQGDEPVIVDTGATGFRDDWIEQVFGLVDPQDVRWIFLSNGDRDHTGNLAAAVDACPRATVVTSPLAAVPVEDDLDARPTRRVCVADGETLDLADRRLIAVRPPTFACPTTRGLYDSATGVWLLDRPHRRPVPHHDRFGARSGPARSTGRSSHRLEGAGMAARASGDLEAAIQRLDDAVAESARHGMRAYEARARNELAAAFTARGTADDVTRATSERARAAEIADAIGLVLPAR
jgi:Metallo-beta-lactamase superfamily